MHSLGNEYGVVALGDQVWMTSNFRASNFNDGSPIPTYYAEWWSSTQYSADLAHTYYASYNDAGLYSGYGKKKAGYAVRCMH